METNASVPPKSANSFAIIANVLAYVSSRDRARFSSAIALSAAASIMEGASILLLVPLLQALQQTGGSFSANLPLDQLPLLDLPAASVSLEFALLALVALVVTQAFLIRTKTLYLVTLLNDLLVDIRRETFDAMSNAEWSFLARQTNARIQHLLTADPDRFDSAAANALALVQALFSLALLGSLSLVLSPAMTAIAAMFGALLLLISYPLRHQAAAYGETTLISRQTQYSTLGRFIGGLKYAKSVNAEEAYGLEFQASVRAFANANRHWIALSSLAAFGFQVASICVLCGFIFLSLTVLHASVAATLALIVVFIRLAPKFMTLQSAMQEILQHAPALQAIRQFQAECRAHAEAALDHASAPMQLNEEIRCKGLSFAYDSNASRQVFSDVSLVVPAKQVTALIGPSGSGKTTLADLLCGLTTAQAGEILVDGVALTGSARRAWRKKVAYVPQDPYLHEGAICANLRVAQPDAPEHELWQALHLANAADFVSRLPQGLQTRLGDIGARLSGGERQRIAIARALLASPLLLILDEATSALDAVNQEAIAATLRDLRGKVTILTIAHRPSMIANADWVIALNNGEVADMGPLEKLARESHVVQSALESENTS